MKQSKLEVELSQYDFINIDEDAIHRCDFIGLDLDHTLAPYRTEPLIELLFDCFLKYLVNYHNWPAEYIFTPNVFDNLRKISMSEIIIDKINHTVIKLLAGNVVNQGYYGFSALSDDKVLM